MKTLCVAAWVFYAFRAPPVSAGGKNKKGQPKLPRQSRTIRRTVESVDAGPTGGLTWDGWVNRGSDQARIEIKDVVAFLNTLTDGYKVESKSGTRAAAN